MSSHHSQKIFNTFSRQRSNAQGRRDQRQAERVLYFNSTRNEIQSRITDWLLTQYFVVLVWLAGIGGIVISALSHVRTS